MRKAIFASVVAILLMSSFSTIVLANPPDNQAAVVDFSSEQILVKFKPDITLPEAAEIHRQLGGQVKETIAGIDVQVVTVPRGQAKDKAKAYSSNPRVAYAEPDFVAQAVGSPDDPEFANQWGMVKVQAPQAWDITRGNPSVTIAILDTGIDPDHPDLANKIVSSINFGTSSTTDDVYGHGTHVAGIAAASTNNGIGVAGMGCDSSVMNVKVLGDTGSGAYSVIASGIIWATDNGAQIINMSLGGWSSSQTLEDAVNYAWSKGVVVVAAAGNLGSTAPIYPAYYTACIAVAGTDASDAKASWSNHGNWVDVAAPGDMIYSTLLDGSYGYKSGTSMATPHVAGLAALVLTTVSDANGNGFLNDEVRHRIESTCDDIGVTGIGYGRINAARAVGDVAPVLPGSISGQVTDAEDGAAIAGATVTDGTRTVLTDAAGLYTINDVPPGSYQVVAGKESYETVALTVNVLSETAAVANFSLNEIVILGSITGSVTDAEDGLPIVGVTVSDGSRTVLTDAAGQYTINDVPPGSYQVVASKEDYESSSLTVTVLEETTTVADFSLSQIVVFGIVSGTVTDAQSGSPVVSAKVTDGTRTTTTDATGRYTIANVPPTTYQVTASKSGYYSSSVSVTVVAGSTAVANFSLNVIPGAITGTVTSAKDGSVIAGVTVTDGTRTATTDSLGKYTIASVPPGTYQVSASKSGYYSSSVSVTVVAGTTAVANFPLSEIIVPGSISGTVTSAKDGSPVVGATVTDGTRTTTSDATGRYTIANVPPGTYQVTASKEGYVSVTSAVTVVSGGAVMTNFSLSPRTPAMWVDSISFIKSGKNLFIQVRVMTANGVLPGAKVGLTLECSSGKVWSFSGTTDTTGVVKFKLGKAPVGNYLVAVNSLTCSGFVWDASKGITATSYALSG